MAYSANRGDNYDASQSYSDQKKAEDARSTQNNAKNIRNAADVAIASKNPYAMAAGAAVKAADKITGGKSTEMLGKGMTQANKMTPGGNRMQRASNQLSESGASDTIGKAASMKNSFGGGGAAGGAAGNAGGAAGGAAGAANGASQVGGGQSGSLPSSSGGGKIAASSGGGGAADTPSVMDRSKKNKDDDDGGDNEDDTNKTNGLGKFLAKQFIITLVLTVGPFLLLILLLIVIIASVTGIFNDYQDAFGMSYTLGQDTGGVVFTSTSEEQDKFLERVNDVKLNYQMQGKTLDAMSIVGILHSLQANGVDIHYEDVTTAVIQEWANATFDGNTYSETVFRKNLESTIFPKYKPNEDAAFYQQMADEVFDYLNRYYDLISDGKTSGSISTGEFSKWKQGDTAWGSTPMGTSGKTLSQIGCLVTSISMQIAKSGVKTNISPFNPGTFVEFLNKNGGIDSTGNFIWSGATKAAPDFKYQGRISLSGLSRGAKFNKIKEIVTQKGVYAVCEVKGNTGQHWVAVDSINGDTINMMDPSSDSTDMWGRYNWNNTSAIVYYKVG